MDRAVPQCFIDRSYRTQPNKSDSLVGLVEEVGEEGTRTFKNLGELWGSSILTEREDRERHQRGSGRPPIIKPRRRR